MNTEPISPADVAEARRARGMKPGELAKRAGIPRRTLYNVERGLHLPQADTLWKITRALRGFDDEAAETTEAAA